MNQTRYMRSAVGTVTTPSLRRAENVQASLSGGVAAQSEGMPQTQRVD